MDSKENSEKSYLKLENWKTVLITLSLAHLFSKKNCIRIRLNMAISKEAVVKS